MTRCEACLCGGVIYADSTEVSAVALQLHNASVTHQIWRAIREGRLSAEEPTTVRFGASGTTGSVSASAQVESDASAPLLRVGYQERRTH